MPFREGIWQRASPSHSPLWAQGQGTSAPHPCRDWARVQVQASTRPGTWTSAGPGTARGPGHPKPTHACAQTAEAPTAPGSRQEPEQAAWAQSRRQVRDRLQSQAKAITEGNHHRRYSQGKNTTPKPELLRCMN